MVFEDGIMKKKEAVVKPNSLAEAGGLYSKVLLDVVDMILPKVGDESEEDKGCLCYDLNLKEYAKSYGFKFDKNLFKKFRVSTKKEFDREPSVSMILPNGHEVVFKLFQELEYSEEDLSVKAMLTTRFKEQLVNLLDQRGRKVFYALTDTLPMRSEYSKKMYPILLERVHKSPTDRMQFSGKGSQQGIYFDRIDPIERFKELLDIPKSYKISNIKTTCTMIANEIETFTPYIARYYFNEYAPGRGRPGVTHICWTMERKEAPADKKKTVIRTDVSEVAQNESISDRIQWLMALAHLGEDSAASIIRKAEKYGRDDDYILKAYSTACSVGADSLGAMLSYFMNHEIENPVSVIKRERVELANERHLDYNAVAMEELMERLVFDDDEDGTKTGEPEFFEEAGSKKDIDGQLGFNV